MNKSGVLAIVIALSIAMVGATIAISYGALKAEADKSHPNITWCYSKTGQELQCSSDHGDCNKAQSLDVDATSGCFKEKFK